MEYVIGKAERIIKDGKTMAIVDVVRDLNSLADRIEDMESAMSHALQSVVAIDDEVILPQRVWNQLIEASRASKTER